MRAVTHFRVTKQFGETTLVEARIATGRMHQIRLHFAAIGYPVVLDDQHGDFNFNKQFSKKYGLKRQFLHASRLEIKHRGRKRVWIAPTPPDLQRVIDALRAENPD
mgnify:CR=1 FL=1